MRVQITKKNVYTFDELTEEQKEKAIEKLYDINIDYEWWDFMFYDAENIGLKLTGFDLDRNRHATGEFLLSAYEVAENIIRDHGDACETYKTASNFLNDCNKDPRPDEDDEDFGDWEDRMIDLESEFLQSLLEDYSIMLQHEFEYKTSEEAIIETIQANGYEFDEDGNLA